MARTHSTPRRLGAALLGALLPLALLAGCTEDDPEPKFTDSPSAEPSSEPTESEPTEPVEPTPPAAMDGNDEAAAKAFVEYYFEVLDYAVVTTETRELKSLAAPSCSTCAGVARIIESTEKNNGSIEGGEHSLKSIALDELAPAQDIRTFRGNMSVFAAEQVIRGSQIEGVDGEFPAGEQDYGIVVVRDADGWKLSDWRSL